MSLLWISIHFTGKLAQNWCCLRCNSKNFPCKAHNNFIAPLFKKYLLTPLQWLFISPWLLYPRCLHTTLASLSLQLVSQTVFHSPDWQISTRPSFAKLPPASLMAPSQQWKSLLVKTIARQIKNNDCHQICRICLTYCELQCCKRALNSNKSTVMIAPCSYFLIPAVSHGFTRL